MANDPAYLALVERFRRVLGGPDLMGHPHDRAEDPSVEQPNLQVGEKRGRQAEESDRKPKKSRGLSDWILVFTFSRKLTKQRYMYNVTGDRVPGYVEKGFADGLFIRNVSSSGNLWALILDNSTGFRSQVFSLSSQFVDKEWILEHWRQHYFITAVAGCSVSGSLVVMSQGPVYGQQSYKLSRANFPFNWVKRKWRQGFFITSIGTSGKSWIVVMSLTSLFKDQVVELDCSYSPERLLRLRSRGFQITAVANTDDHSAVVLSQSHNQQFPFQEVKTSSSFPSSHVKKHWTRNMYVTSLGFGRTNLFEGKGLKLAINREEDANQILNNIPS